MPNAGKHAAIGAGVGLIVYLGWKILRNEDPTLEGAIGALVLTSMAALLPDMLEPPTNPMHRAFFHSLVSLVGAAGVGLHAVDNEEIGSPTGEIVALVACGYISHLVADSTTPAGLPPA